MLKNFLPISEYQQRFFLEWVLAPEDSTYNVSLIYKIKGNLDKAKLIQACEILIKNHELVHARYNEDGSKCYFENYSTEVFIHEIELDSEKDVNLQLKEILDTSFNLTKDVLLAFFIIKNNNVLNEYYLIIRAHHIIADAYSATVLVNEVSKNYNLLINNCQPSNNIDKIFTNAVKAEQEILTLEYKQKAKEFWLNFISDFPLNIQLPYKSGINSHDLKNQFANKKGEFIYFDLGEQETKVLKEYARKNKSTVFIVLAAIYGFVVSKYSNQSKLLLSYPINMRPKGYMGVTGCFVNNLPLKIDLDQNEMLDRLIARLTLQRKAVKDYQGYSLTHIIEDQRKYNQTQETNFFNVGFTQANLNVVPLILEGLESEAINIPSSSNLIDEFDLQYDDGVANMIKFRLGYRIALFNRTLIDTFINSFKSLIFKIINHEFISYKTYCVLDADTYKQIVYQYNATVKPYPQDKTIHQLFEEQVKKIPNNIAIVYEDGQLTYKELNERSNQLASYLRKEYKIKLDDLIALCLDRSEYMLIAILGVLKAGAAYVPIAPDYPGDRINYILEDTKTKVLVTDIKSADKINNLTKHLSLQTLHGKVWQSKNDNTLVIDDNEFLQILENYSKFNPKLNINSNNLAYVIYTSGTTGKPKGVMIEHRGIVNLTYGLNKRYKLGVVDNNEVILQFSNYVFDASVEQIVLSLLNGYKLLLLPDKLWLSKDDFYKYLKMHQVTHIDATPTFLSQYNFKSISSLRRIISGGELLTINDYNSLSRYSISVFNVYGPTESTVSCLASDVADGNINLGNPLNNICIYILDGSLNPLPIGCIGELYIGGAGLARGYLNLPELTTEQFIPNPFQTELQKQSNTNYRIYKTGDLVRMLPDGNIEYIGRNDFQVKIRGYRIELGEIESQLAKYDGVKQAVVLAMQHFDDEGNLTGNKYLAAYYVAEAKLDETAILNYLNQKLPDYMVPGIFIHLDKLPLTINGKLDRKSLPNPEFTNIDVYVAPKNNLEIQLTSIWSEILNLKQEKIGINDSFFKLGGNSILIIKLKSRLGALEEFRDITVADLFKYHTISKLVESINYNKNDEIKLQNTTLQINKDIAIIAASGAFSGCSDSPQFWAMIKEGKEGVRRYSLDECRGLGVAEEILQSTDYIAVGGHVPDIDLFDAQFWGLSSSETSQTDPQIRKFLEHCWYALEESGYIKQRKELNIGLFAGSGDSIYFYENILSGENKDKINLWEASTMNSKDALATKVSFLLGLTGPSSSINTACSTGLVTVVEACKDLSIGACDMALAGGVSLAIPDKIGYIYQEGMIASKDGYCRTFDKDSSGTIGGSGVGVVLLKRLNDAVSDGDKIIAVIKGYAMNNDGDRKIGYTAPSVIGQAECILNAQRMAGISSNEVNYVECHGTATNLGDPIEIQALKEAFALNANITETHRQNGKCILGAVKANIGHADSAAGIAGLIKVCSMLEHNTIPGQINFNEANPELHLETTNFEIITHNREWLPNQDRRVAGVSSFGIGGTNAHVIVSEYIADMSTHQEENVNSLPINDSTEQNYFLPITAKSKKSLEKYILEFSKYLKFNQNINLEDVAYTLQQKREFFDYRLAITARTIEEAITKLDIPNKAIHSSADINKQLSTIFMFPGQGSQYTNMCIELYQNDSFFNSTVYNCIEIVNNQLKNQTNIDFAKVLYPDIYGVSDEEDIDQTKWTQISLFVVSYSLAKLLNKLNINADAYIGHSVGEYVAATLSGVFGLEDAIKIVLYRGKVMQSMQPGSMLSVQACYEQINGYANDNNCEIAVINTSDSCVAAGTIENIEQLKIQLKAKEISSIVLKTSHAYHSYMMEDAAKDFITIFKDIRLHTPNKKFISNISGDFITNSEAIDPKYWARQIRSQVQFNQGITRLCDYFRDEVVFIEVGAGKGLSTFVKTHVSKTNQQVFRAIQLVSSEAERNNLSMQSPVNTEDIIGILWANGYQIDLINYQIFARPKIINGLPHYQFDSKSYWIKKQLNADLVNKLRLLPQDDWYSIPTWKRVANLNNDLKKIKPFNQALFFTNNSKPNFSQNNSVAVRTIFVILDYDTEVFNSYNPLILKINPTQESSYIALTAFLRENQINIDLIIHSASMMDNLKTLHDPLDFSFYSLFMIRQYVLPKITINLLIVLTDGLSQITGVDHIKPFNGTLVGAIRNIKHELPHINSLIADIGDNVLNIEYFVSQALVNQEYAKTDKLLAFRFGALWIEEFEKPRIIQPDSIIYENDTILITGGLDGVALSIANRISLENKVRFILVSRNNIYADGNNSPYNLNQINLIDNIKLRGCNVDICCLDIANASSVKSLIDDLQLKYGAINGVIHTAGSIPISSETYSLINVKKAFGGKIYGIDNIINCINKHTLRYLVSTSSLASILGDLNCIEYCAANSYLDYLSANKTFLPNTRVISINWPGWSDTGMAMKYAPAITKNKKPNIIELNTVTSNEAGKIFYKLLNQFGFNQIIVSKLNIELIREKLFDYSIQNDISKEVIKILEGTYSDVEYKVAQIYCEILGIDSISIQDDFFRLGGDSILAIKLTNQINTQNPNAKVTVADIFKYKNIKRLADYIIHHAGDSDYQAVKISKYNLPNKEDYKLSFAQERLWFIDNLEQGTNAYNIAFALKLAESTNEEYLCKALEDIVKRHEILRTVIKQDINSSAYQETLEFSSRKLISKHSYSNMEELHKYIAENCNYIFKLDVEYPIKIDFYSYYSYKNGDLDPYFCRDDSKDRVLLIVIHHIAFDGWSTEVFLHEVNAGYRYYEELATNEDTILPSILKSLPIQYRDYALWQREYLSGVILDTQLGYWKEKLSDYENLYLMPDKQRPLMMDYVGANIYFKLDEGISTELRNLSKKLGISLYSVMLGSYYLLLSAYSNQTDIVIGTPVANRHYSGLEHLIGFFVNTLAIRHKIDKSQTVFEYLGAIGNKVIEAQLHQDLPFEKLVDHLNAEKDQSRHPIFQVMFGVQSFGAMDSKTDTIKSKDHAQHLFEPYTIEAYIVAQFDMTTMIDDSGIELKGSFNYRTSLYNQSTIGNLVKTYKVILENIVKSDSQTRLNQIQLLSQEDYYKLVITYNQTEKEYPQDKTIPQLFEEQVKNTPNNIAIVYEDKQLTYKVLNEKANQLANYLREEYKIKGDDLIALCLDRSEYMLIVILGVLKSGGAYVPIDLGHSEDRISYILEDTQAKILIVDTSAHKLLQKSYNKAELPLRTLLSRLWQSLLVIYNNEFLQKLEKYPKFNPKPNINSNNLAYVIYTSGTTGRPKGVLQQHNNVHRLLTATDNWYQFNSNDVWTLFHSYIFDFTVWELWGSLCYGGKLVIPTLEQIKDTALFYKLCREKKITVLNQTPKAFYEFINIALDNEKLRDLRYVIFGGDALNLISLKPWFAKYGYNKPKLVNMYGITETTVHVTYKEIHKEDINEISNIGKLIPDQKYYILDNNLNPLPIGAIGELYIGGAGLARGYLNQSELTVERFLPNSFQTEAEKLSNINSRIYKTGDLVRMLPDGNIEYIGRNDFQVKIRGFRIELGEIELQLSKYDGVKQAVVLALEHMDTESNLTGNKYLAAYYVAETKLDEVSILDYLSQKLPDYMVPAILVHLEKIPLTINGKLYRKALPNLEFTSGNIYVAPRNDLETKLCAIYAEVLKCNVEKVGITDDFFALGGDSIRTIQLITKINRAYNISVKARDIFTYRTIAKLMTSILFQIDATRINSENGTVVTWRLGLESKNECEELRQEYSLQAVYPATLMQGFMIERFQVLNPSVYYFQSCIKLTEIEINSDKIAKVESLIKNTFIFKTYFIQNNNKMYQAVRNSINFKINIIHLEGRKIEEAIDSFMYQARVRSFDVFDENEILLTMTIFKASELESYAYIGMHHAIIDGWSNILFLNKILSILLMDNSYELTNLLTVPFYQYVYLEQEIIKNQDHLNFWIKHLKGYTYSPLKATMKQSEIGLIKEAKFNLGKNKKELSSIKTFFLYHFMQVLSSLTNTPDICVGVVTNTRYDDIEDSLNAIGLHWNLAPIRMNVETDDSQSLDEFLALVDTEHGRYPLPCILKDCGVSELFFATFKYLNFHNQDSYPNGISVFKVVDLYSYPLNFTIIRDEIANSYAIRVDYMLDYFSDADIDMLIKHFLCSVA